MTPSNKVRRAMRTGTGHVGSATRVMVGDRTYRVWLESETVEVRTKRGNWRRTTSRRIETAALLRASDAVNAKETP